MELVASSFVAKSDRMSSLYLDHNIGDTKLSGVEDISSFNNALNLSERGAKMSRSGWSKIYIYIRKLST